MSQFLKPVSIETAPKSAKPLLEAIQSKYGMIPNLMGNFAHNPEALKSYLALSESFASAGLNPLEQQVVALAVSRENGCNYCMAAHSAMSAMSKLDESVIQKVRNGETLPDKKLETLRTFTKRVVSARGWLDESDTHDFLAAGHSKEQVLAVIIGVTMKTLSNYVNHLAETEVDQPFKSFSWTR